MRHGICLIIAAAMLVSVPVAHGQIGKLLREGAEALGKKSVGSGARQAAREGAETSFRQGLQRASGVAVQDVSGTIAASSGAAVSKAAIRALEKHGAATALPMIRRYGEDGARAMARLSPEHARRMVIMSDTLARNGRGADFMRVLAERGDVAAEWLWNNKGSVLVGTTAVAFLANPDEFLYATEIIATRAIETAGAQVARPLIEGTTQHVAPVMVDRVVSPVAQRMAGPIAYGLLAGMALLAAVVWVKFVRPRWRSRPAAGATNP